MSDAEHKLNRLPIDHPSSYGGMMQENAALHAEVARLTAEVDRKDNAWRDAERHIRLLAERLAAAERLAEEIEREVEKHPDCLREGTALAGALRVCKSCRKVIAANWLPQDEAKGGGG